MGSSLVNRLVELVGRVVPSAKVKIPFGRLYEDEEITVDACIWTGDGAMTVQRGQRAQGYQETPLLYARFHFYRSTRQDQPRLRLPTPIPALPVLMSLSSIRQLNDSLGCSFSKVANCLNSRSLKIDFRFAVCRFLNHVAAHL